MTYTWTEERWAAKEINYRVPGRALVARSWGGWYHVSLFNAETGRWERQDGVYAHADEAREWAELLLDDIDDAAPVPTRVFTVSYTVEVSARTEAEAIEAARSLRDRAELTVTELEMIG